MYRDRNNCDLYVTQIYVSPYKQIIGLEVLEDGENAVDAAVAVGYALATSLNNTSS